MGAQVLLESSEDWMANSLCTKNEKGILMAVVANWKDQPLLIKKNQVLGVVSSDWEIYEKENDFSVNMMELDRKKDTEKINMKEKEKVRLMLEDMEKRKIIKKCTSPWASPVVLVKKKDGTIRMCVDYRKLNSVIRLNAHPLPHIESTLQALGDKKWFTTLDLMAGYWQIPMEEGSKEKTAFTVLNEHFQFEVMPFGLATSPAIFQAAMEQVLGELLGKSVFVYIDD
uniref:Reverse transcriptase domain-containing protein n=1 Tax=Caenorhabditis japonica TaxID=281687 RepID=A0A8R1E9X5_CAEJA